MMFFYRFQYTGQFVGIYSVSEVVCMCKLNVFLWIPFYDFEMEKYLNHRIKWDKYFICQSNDVNVIDPSKKKVFNNLLFCFF